MPKRSGKPPADLNALAAYIVRSATAEGKDPLAVELGRRGGLKGGPARAAKLTKKRLSEIGKKGAAIRWKDRKKS